MKNKQPPAVTREEALAFMRRINPKLPGALETADDTTVLSVHSVLRADAKDWYKSALAENLQCGLNYRHLTIDSLKLMLPSMEATARAGHSPLDLYHAMKLSLIPEPGTAGVKLVFGLKPALPLINAAADAGHNPADLATLLRRGISSKELTPESLRIIAPAIKAAASPDSHPSYVAEFLVKCLKSKIPPDSVEMTARSLAATARAGHNPVNLAHALGEGLDSKAIDAASLPQAAKTIRAALEASADAGHNPAYLANTFAMGLGRHMIGPRDLVPYARMLRRVSRKWDPGKLVDHALKVKTVWAPGDKIIRYQMEFARMGHFPDARFFSQALEARKLGVPSGKIIPYQVELAKKGHFPNAGLVKELHEAKIRERKK